MAQSTDLNSICSQLLRPDDLSISSDLAERIKREGIVSLISIHKNNVSIKIYSTHPLYLSSMTPVLHDFGFNIIDEITYTVPKGKDSLHVNRFNIEIDDLQNSPRQKRTSKRSSVSPFLARRLKSAASMHSSTRKTSPFVRSRLCVLSSSIWTRLY